jgi:hypothetical protein
VVSLLHAAVGRAPGECAVCGEESVSKLAMATGNSDNY